MSQPAPTPIERRRTGWLRRVARSVAPLLLGALVVIAWQSWCDLREVPTYLLPSPKAVGQSFLENRAELLDAAWVTLRTTLAALTLAVASGVLLALVMTTSRWLELSLFPYAVVLQVTPLVVIAPLLLLWIVEPWKVLLVCAWIVAFFPMLSSTVIGLRSADRGLRDLFTLYRASPWQRFRLLLVPSALPYFLSGLRVSVNLSLIGAVVGEFVTGANAERPGLAAIVFEAQYRTDMDRTFAALAMISLLGIGLYFATHQLSQWLLGRWHESAMSDRP